MRRLRVFAVSLLCCVGVAQAQIMPQVPPSAGVTSVTGDAGSVPWRARRFVYQAEGKPLSGVLTDFASSQGIPAVVDPGVTGSVRASFDASPARFLEAISRAYGVIWYYDGSALYFYPARSIQSRIFRLDGYEDTQIKRLLKSLNIAEGNYPLRYDQAEKTLMVSGPPQQVETVAAVINSLNEGASESRARVTRVFPLRYASAADRRVGETTLSGVASLMDRLYGGDNVRSNGEATAPVQGEVEQLARKSSTLQRMYGFSDAAPHIPDDARQREMQAGDSGSGLWSGNGNQRGEGGEPKDAPPSIVADEGTNSVVIYGRSDQMPEYRKLIQSLDTVPAQVELEAMILDVDNDSVDSLGIAWSYSSDHFSGGVEPPKGANDPGNFTISTLWQNAGRELLARINALQADGNARVIARPRVVGVVNRAALMRDRRVASVRVAGNLDTSLYQIEAGTEMQVTPQIIGSYPRNKIKLTIAITDGKFEDALVDEIPVVKKTEIRTETYISEGESLLIGGITSESDIRRQSGVPGLQSIPIIGALFRWNMAQEAHSERLFLLTPRVVRETAAATLSRSDDVRPVLPTAVSGSNDDRHPSSPAY